VGAGSGGESAFGLPDAAPALTVSGRLAGGAWARSGLGGWRDLTSLRPRRHHLGHRRTALIQTQTVSVYRRWRTTGPSIPAPLSELTAPTSFTSFGRLDRAGNEGRTTLPRESLGDCSWRWRSRH